MISSTVLIENPIRHESLFLPRVCLADLMNKPFTLRRLSFSHELDDLYYMFCRMGETMQKVVLQPMDNPFCEDLQLDASKDPMV